VAAAATNRCLLAAVKAVENVRFLSGVVRNEVRVQLCEAAGNPQHLRHVVPDGRLGGDGLAIQNRP
jgi:hypothetical protein